jgi:beta-phosphoglucomutase-like phosphatase (HAD superfamily)
MESICVIFDMDGTLVDSETLGTQAFLDLLPDLADPVELLTERYRGMRMSTILENLESHLGRPLPEDFEVCYRTRVSELFKGRRAEFVRLRASVGFVDEKVESARIERVSTAR